MEPSWGINGRGAKNKPRLILVTAFTFIACLGAFLMGFNIGYATQTLEDLNSINGSASIGVNNTAETGAFTAISPLGALVGGLVAGWASDTFGRKPAIMAGTLPQLVGWVAISLAHLVPKHWGFLSVILLGRFLTGLGMGWNSLCIPVYITEISPIDKRGFFGSWNQLFVTIGVLAAFCLGIPQKYLYYYYVSTFAVSVVTIFMVAMLFVEESPVWLLTHGKLGKGEKVLQRLRGPHVDVNKEIDEITGNLIQPEKMSLVKSLLQLRRCAVMVPFLLSLGVMFFQQFSGVNALVFYANQELKKAGVPDYNIVSAMTVGGTQVLFTIIGILLVERLGRKILLVASSVGLMASCIGLAVDLYLVGLQAGNDDYAKKYSPLAITSFVVFNAAFSVGWGPLPWVMMSELVPTSVRGISTGVATAFNWGSVALITFGVNYYEGVVHPYGLWFTFGGIMFVSIFFVVFLTPETKGRSMDEIQQTFESFSYQRYLCPKKRRSNSGSSSDNEPLLFDSKVGNG